MNTITSGSKLATNDFAAIKGSKNVVIPLIDLLKRNASKISSIGGGKDNVFCGTIETIIKDESYSFYIYEVVESSLGVDICIKFNASGIALSEMVMHINFYEDNEIGSMEFSDASWKVYSYYYRGDTLMSKLCIYTCEVDGRENDTRISPSNIAYNFSKYAFEEFEGCVSDYFYDYLIGMSLSRGYAYKSRGYANK